MLFGGYSVKAPWYVAFNEHTTGFRGDEALLMSTHKCFHGEIKKHINDFRLKKIPYLRVPDRAGTINRII